MSWIEVSSDSISLTSDDITYGIAKYPIRKQFALVRYSPNVIEIAAYFRTEQHALDFAESMGLDVTDHRTMEDNQ